MAASDQSALRQRVLAVKVEIDWKDAESKQLYQRLRDLSWAAARYRNGFIRRRWAEAMGWSAPSKEQDAAPDKHSLTKQARAAEKELGEPVKSAAEREVEGAWTRHAKEVLAGRPIPEWKPTAALSLRGRKDKKESGIRIEIEKGQYVAYLRALSKHCDSTWLRLPIAKNTRRDEYQSPILDRMVSGDLPVAKATVAVKRHALILRVTYALEIPLPRMGARVATLGPVKEDGRLFLRTELETKDYTSKLQEVLRKKDEWDLIRRRVTAQIGWRKGQARAKRERLQRLSWDDWLRTYLHTWSRQIAEWLKTQGVGTLQVQSIDTGDWPAYKFVELLKYKAEERGIAMTEGADITSESAYRAAKQEVARDRRSIKKRAEAVRELSHQIQKGN